MRISIQPPPARGGRETGPGGEEEEDSEEEAGRGGDGGGGFFGSLSPGSELDDGSAGILGLVKRTLCSRKMLRSLGYWPPLSGFSRRPLLLGGEATEKALRGLLGLSGPGAPISGNPLALRRRPAYRADRGCLIPGVEAPGGGDDGQLGKSDREGVAEPPGAKTGPSAGPPEASGKEPAQPQAGTKGKRRPPAIIRLPAKERKAVYAKVAPGQGKRKLKKFGKTWRCIPCNRPGFNNPSQLRATICFGEGMKGGKVISLQKGRRPGRGTSRKLSRPGCTMPQWRLVAPDSASTFWSPGGTRIRVKRAALR